ncbi:hypothetical protein INR49_012557, partial [Caranx melampygus]
MWGAARRRSDSKSEATLKKGGKKQEHLQSDHSGAYTKEKVSLLHSATEAMEHTPSLDSLTFLPSSQVISETSRAKSQVCLKDLCPEDKRRIANLIGELARVSEEKEESVQRLKDEQENFERKIQQLEQQNVIIAQERESLQQQYRECQELLALYQQYLSQQQAKLNESIAQLSQAPAHSKVLRSEEVHSRASTSRANGSVFDGSYLSYAATRAHQPQVQRRGEGGRGAAQTLSNPASLSYDSEFSPSDRPVREQRIHRRECREPPPEPCHTYGHCQVSGQDSGYGTQQRRRENSSYQENGHRDTLNPHECERFRSGPAMGSEAKEALTRPLLGHEDWEEKRHQLLLQKMQLEMERERLQARLDEQEERLNRQKQQLCQSRLDYSRFQQAAQAEVSSPSTRNGVPQLDGPSHQDLSSSECGDAEVHPTEQNSQPVAAPLENGMQKHETLEQPRRDMATSPAKPPPSLSKPSSVPVIPETPDARLDFSVVELLDIFSPVSAPEQIKPSTRRTKTTQQGSKVPGLAVPGQEVSEFTKTQREMEEKKKEDKAEEEEEEEEEVCVGDGEEA